MAVDLTRCMPPPKQRRVRFEIGYAQLGLLVLPCLFGVPDSLLRSINESSIGSAIAQSRSATRPREQPKHQNPRESEKSERNSRDNKDDKKESNRDNDRSDRRDEFSQ